MASVVPCRTVGPNTQQSHTHTHARCHTDGERVQLHISLAFTPSTSKRHRWLAFFFQCGSLHGTRSLVYIHPFFLDYNSLFFFLWMCVLCSHACVFIGISLTFFFFHCYPLFVILRFTIYFFFFGEGTPVLVIKTPNQQQS